jgi:hypothetical protein
MNNSEDCVLLFHGTRKQFSIFSPRFIGSGEGVNNTDIDGFFFIDSLKGAYKHCRSYLRCSETEGYVLVCLVPVEFLEKDVELSDNAYHGTTSMVKKEFASKVKVVEAIPYSVLHEEINGKVKEYSLGETKELLGNTNWLSHLKLSN